MKLFFLHGLGQDADSWAQVQQSLADFDTEALPLFPQGNESYQQAKQAVLARLKEENQPFVLVGLSLGGVLALDLSDQRLPQLKGLVLSASQYKLKGHLLYKLQLLLFSLLPKSFFSKQGADKVQMMGILKELAQLDLTDKAEACQVPSLILCGSQDKVNLTSSRALSRLLPKADLRIIPQGPHTLNTDKPLEMSQAIADFIRQF